MLEKLSKCPDKLPKSLKPASAGGLNPCLMKPEGSKLRFQNCVFWAWHCWYVVTGHKLPSMNAALYAEWARTAKYTVSQQPTEGALAVWKGGKAGNGHIACVIEVKPNGDIITSESGWSYTKSEVYTTQRKHGGKWGQPSNYVFAGFILPPDSVAALPLHRALKLGSSGADVRGLQVKLHSLGFLRASEVDGDFGKITYSAVCGFQCWNGLEVDGCAGPETQKALFGGV